MKNIIADPGAEKAVLACMLLNTDALQSGLSSLSADCFSQRSYRLIYEAIGRAVADSKPVNRITVRHALQSMGMLSAAGGDDVLLGLTDELPIVSDTLAYIGLVLEYHYRRSVSDLAVKLHSQMRDPGCDLEEVTQQAAEAMENILSTGSSENYRPWTEAWTENWEQLVAGAGDFPEWPWEGLSADIMPLTGDNLIVIAGLSAHGKTTFACQLAYHWCMGDIPVAIMSLEMSTSNLVNKFLQFRSRVSARQALTIASMSAIERTTWDQTQLDKYTQALDALESRESLTIDDNAGLIYWTVLKSRIERLHRQGKARVVIIDYLGLIDLGGTRGMDQAARYREIGKRLKLLAKRLRIDIVICHQINKTAVGQPGKERPVLTDLEFGGEKDADTVLIVNQPGMYLNPSDFKTKDSALDRIPCAGFTEICIAKNRNGPANKVLPFQFDMITGFFKPYEGSYED